MPRRTSGPGPRSLAPKRSINCGSQWFTGSMSTCTSPFLFYTSHISPLALTGNTFLCNLPWQGENISIKQRLPRQTSLVLDNLSDRAVCLSAQLCPHVILLSVFYTLFDSLSPPPTFSVCLPDRYICYSQMHVCFKVACSLSRWLCPLRPAASVDFSRDCCVLLLPHECSNHTTFNFFCSLPDLFCICLFFFFCSHRCAVPILASGWVEVSSDRQAQHHWWKGKPWLNTHICLSEFYSCGCWWMPFVCQVLIWWGDSLCSRVQMSRRSATLEDPSSSDWARPHSCAPPSEFTAHCPSLALIFQHLQTKHVLHKDIYVQL